MKRLLLILLLVLAACGGNRPPSTTPADPAVSAPTTPAALPLHFLAIWVTDPSGRPVAGVSVDVSPVILGAPVTFPPTNADGWSGQQVRRGEYRVRVAVGNRARESIATIQDHTDVRLTLPAAQSIAAKPLVGRVRALGRSFGDDNGARQLLFTSWFPALRIWKDDRARAIEELDAIAAAGWQGIRVFAAVGGWSTYWDGREVVPLDLQKWVPDSQHHAALHGTHIATIPAWPDYDDLFRAFLIAVKERGLKLNLTTGDMQMFVGGDEEVALHERLARIVRDVDPTLVAVWETWNEPFQNNRLGEGEPGIDERAKNHGRRIMAAVRAILPGQLCSMGSSTGAEDPEPMIWWAEHADVVDLHGSRSGDHDMSFQTRRSFGVAYWNGELGFNVVGGKPFWQGEPAGPDGAGRNLNYIPTNQPENLWALYTMHVLTGQGTVFHGGSGVRYIDDVRLSDQTGFLTLPKWFAQFPDDIGQWSRLTHGNRADSPLTADNFADAGGEGPERVDQVYNDRELVALIYGGAGEWRLRARRAMRIRVFDHTGQLGEPVDVWAGERLPGAWQASGGPRVVLADFR